MYKVTGRVGGTAGNWLVVKEKKFFWWKKIAEFAGEKAFERTEKYITSLLEINSMLKGKK